MTSIGMIPIPYDINGPREWIRTNRSLIASIGFSLRLIERMRGIIHFNVIAKPGLIRQGDSICDVVCGHGTVEINSAISGIFLGFNPRLLADPSLIESLPTEETWVYQIKSTKRSEHIMFTFPL